MTSLQDSCGCEQNDALAVRHASSIADGCSKRTKTSQQLGFLDLPPEVRRIIYEYIFSTAVLRIGKNGVDTKRSWGNLQMLQTSRFVLDEAQVPLFSRAKQAFRYDPFQDDSSHEMNLHLKPLHPKLVPSLQITSYEITKNFCLDMRVMSAYKKLREVEIGVFSCFEFEDAPFPILKEGKSVNDANNYYLVAEIKKQIVDKAEYKCLPYKPLSLPVLKRICDSKTRKFSIHLRCIVELCYYLGGNVEEENLRISLDWDNEVLLENERIANVF